ncbi:hypothetical protein [Ereboglobus luteus]|uniref:hypothetical protein n=1 Tax=Ereboglobus luteus TaxID=1796921 RepID=UPI00126028DC|nr:hypothetical protein [Ereboglobus luteus]
MKTVFYYIISIILNFENGITGLNAVCNNEAPSSAGPLFIMIGAFALAVAATRSKKRKLTRKKIRVRVVCKSLGIEVIRESDTSDKYDDDG